MSHQVDVRKVDVGNQLVGNMYLVADIFPPRGHFARVLGRHLIFSICFPV
jgi:hypothetical protein